MKKRKLYPDSTFAPGDMVVEYVPYPNQEDNAFDDGPRRRYGRNRGIFIGNLQEYGHSSLIKVGEEEIEVARRELCYDVREDHKSPTFLKRHAKKEVELAESMIQTLEERYLKDRSSLEEMLKKAREKLEAA